jgi:DNA mismatch repair protein MutS
LVEGGTNRSYGIQVGRLAGIPAEVLDRAKEILTNIEAGEFDGVGLPHLGHRRRGDSTGRNVQLALFGSPHDTVINGLKKLDIDTMSPLEALNQLHTLKGLLGDS